MKQYVDEFIKQAPSGAVWVSHARTVITEYQKFLIEREKQSKIDHLNSFAMMVEAAGLMKAFDEHSKNYYAVLMSKFSQELLKKEIITERQAAEAFSFLTDGLTIKERQDLGTSEETGA